MAVRSRRKSSKIQRRFRLRFQDIPFFIQLAITIWFIASSLLMVDTLARELKKIELPRIDLFSYSNLSPVFTPQVHHWSNKITAWSNQYDLEPNLMATVMQIESCGHPTVASYAGAQGLFQVMPFHFAQDENQLDPDTNAKRSAGVLQQCQQMTNGDVGFTLACYNGGPSVLQRPWEQWADETRRYYIWGVGIYTDAMNGNQSSGVLQEWLNAGGQYLCDRAGQTLEQY